MRVSGPCPGLNLQPRPPRLQVGDVEGIRAAAISSPSPNATVGLFVGAGSANETPETAGAAKLMEYMAFKVGRRQSALGAGAAGAAWAWGDTRVAGDWAQAGVVRSCWWGMDVGGGCLAAAPCLSSCPHVPPLLVPRPPPTAPPSA